MNLARGVTRYICSLRALLIVIACNTASAAALKTLRQEYPEVPLVGSEPAVKPAAEQTHSGKVGVLATPSTFQGGAVCLRGGAFCQWRGDLPGDLPRLWSARSKKAGWKRPKPARSWRQPCYRSWRGVDTLVMGCTHFPFVIPPIEQITEGKARVIDPAPAVARQTQRVLEERGLLNPKPGAGITLLHHGQPSQVCPRKAAPDWRAGTSLPRAGRVKT